MKAALSLIVLSLALLGFSMSLEPFYRNPDGYYPFHNVAQGDSQAYYAARSQALTPKYRLQDYGATMLMLGLVAVLVSWRPVKAPRSRLGFIALAVIAPTLTAAGFVFDLVQGQSRWEFPPWADSLGIPLMGVPVMLLLGLVGPLLITFFLPAFHVALECPSRTPLYGTAIRGYLSSAV